MQISLPQDDIGVVLLLIFAGALFFYLLKDSMDSTLLSRRFSSLHSIDREIERARAMGCSVAVYMDARRKLQRRLDKEDYARRTSPLHLLIIQEMYRTANVPCPPFARTDKGQEIDLHGMGWHERRIAQATVSDLRRMASGGTVGSFSRGMVHIGEAIMTMDTVPPPPPQHADCRPRLRGMATRQDAAPNRAPTNAPGCNVPKGRRFKF